MDRDNTVALLHAPARDGIQCRRAPDLSCAETKGGMMPWASDCIADKQTLSEWRAIVRAGSANCKHPVAAAREQDSLVPEPAHNHSSLRQQIERTYARHIRTRFRGYKTHNKPPWETSTHRAKIG